jgi:hypothetical protein
MYFLQPFFLFYHFYEQFFQYYFMQNIHNKTCDFLKFYNYYFIFCLIIAHVHSFFAVYFSVF